MGRFDASEVIGVDGLVKGVVCSDSDDLSER